MQLLIKLKKIAVRLTEKVYSLSMGLARRLQDGARWRPLAQVFQFLNKSPIIVGIELFVALALSVNFFFLVRPTCHPSPDGNAISQQLFSYLSVNANPAAKKQIQLNWRKRLAGPMLAGWLLDLSFKDKPVSDGRKFENLFGFYQTSWLFLLFLILILFQRFAVLIMLGVMGGMMYHLSEPTAQFYPWDIATMFFFTFSCILYRRQRLGLLMLVVWIGALYKETTLCCALLILFGENWSWRKRITGFVALVGITFISYRVLMWLFGMEAPLLAMNQAKNIHDLFWKSVLVSNVHTLFSLSPRHVIFANAGTLVIMLLIPWKNRQEIAIKMLVIVYLIGEFFWGIIDEFRIWFEVLPLGWMMIGNLVFAKNLPDHQNSTKTPRPVLIGSYWLMLSMLVTIAGLICLATPTPPRPTDEPVNQMSFVELFRAAKNGDAAAEYKIAMYYRSGFIVNQSDTEATLWYQRAAEKNYTPAQVALGVMLIQNDTHSTLAAQLFDQAAAAGNIDAQYNLGTLYMNGWGVAQNYGSASQWFQKAAGHGSATAQRKLGLLFLEGQGVKPDLIVAYKWLKLASLQEDDEATAKLKDCAARMTPQQINAAEKMVRAFVPEQNKTSP